MQLVIVTQVTFITYFSAIRIKVQSDLMTNQSNGHKTGRAYIWVNGVDLSQHIDGHNLVTLDFDTGKSRIQYFVIFLLQIVTVRNLILLSTLREESKMLI